MEQNPFFAAVESNNGHAIAEARRILLKPKLRHVYRNRLEDAMFTAGRSFARKGVIINPNQVYGLRREDSYDPPPSKSARKRRR